MGACKIYLCVFVTLRIGSTEIIHGFNSCLAAPDRRKEDSADIRYLVLHWFSTLTAVRPEKTSCGLMRTQFACVAHGLFALGCSRVHVVYWHVPGSSWVCFSIFCSVEFFMGSIRGLLPGYRTNAKFSGCHERSLERHEVFLPEKSSKIACLFCESEIIIAWKQICLT